MPGETADLRDSTVQVDHNKHSHGVTHKTVVMAIVREQLQKKRHLHQYS